MPAGSTGEGTAEEREPKEGHMCHACLFPSGQPPTAPADSRNSCWGSGPVPAKLVDFYFIVLKKHMLVGEPLI